MAHDATKFQDCTNARRFSRDSTRQNQLMIIYDGTTRLDLGPENDLNVGDRLRLTRYLAIATDYPWRPRRAHRWCTGH